MFFFPIFAHCFCALVRKFRRLINIQHEKNDFDLFRYNGNVSAMVTMAGSLFNMLCLYLYHLTVELKKKKTEKQITRSNEISEIAKHIASLRNLTTVNFPHWPFAARRGIINGVCFRLIFCAKIFASQCAKNGR